MLTFRADSPSTSLGSDLSNAILLRYRGTKTMKSWHAVAYLNLLVLAADHLTTGLAGALFPKRAAGLYQSLFRARLPADSPLAAIPRPWGALGAVALLPVPLPGLESAR